MALFHGIFGTQKTIRQSDTAGTPRTVSIPAKGTVTLTRGEVVKGEVIDLRSNEVTIRLEDGKTLHAKLASAMDLSIGQTSSFFVQETNDALITLKLLSTEDVLPSEAAIDRALEASGLPKSAHMTAIVRSLLEAGLPASKDMIQKMLQHSAANKEVAFSTLTALLKHNLPVTKENAVQLQAYRNFEHRLLGQATTLTTALTEVLHSSGTTPSFTKELLSHFFENEAPAGLQPSSVTDDASCAPSAATAPFHEAPQEPSLPDSSLPAVKAATQETKALLSSSTAPVTHKAHTPLPDAVTPLREFLSETDYKTLEKALASFFTDFPDSPDFQSLKHALTNGTLTAPHLFRVLSSAIKAGHSTAVAKQLQETPLLSSLLGKTILNRFVLTPEDLTKPHAVKEFYARVQKDLAVLSELASSAPDSPATKSVADTSARMQDNLQFMNTLNQMFPYLQLPLKFTEQLTHGELYVYTKKKDLSSQRKEVSVLLHLDMDSLGPTDIHLTLLAQQVTAKFYLNKGEGQALLEKELPLLADVLQKKGYTLHASVTERIKEPDIVADFMDGGETISMKRFRFDIRA